MAWYEWAFPTVTIAVGVFLLWFNGVYWGGDYSDCPC